MSRAARVLFLCGIAAATPPASVAAATGRAETVRMETLEVQGSRERPDRLYLPAPDPPAASPVPLDCFREDIGRPLDTPAERTGHGDGGGP